MEFNTEKYDVSILGSGPAGYFAAIKLSQLGKKVLLVEKDKIGGVCLNVGCIPTKTMIQGAKVFDEILNAEQYGITVNKPSVNSNIFVRPNNVAVQVCKNLESLLNKNNVNVVKGNAFLEDKNSISVILDNCEKQYFKSEKIIIATGSRPKLLKDINVDRKRIFTSNEVFSLGRVPKSIVIIGAGAIGAEFAYIFSTLQTKVYIIEIADQILPCEDKDISEYIARVLKRKGCEMFTSFKVEGIIQKEASLEVNVASENRQAKIESECVLVCVGRTPNIDNIGIEKLGIRCDKGYIEVNKFMQTSIKNIYAVGDVLNTPAFAHVAYHEALAASENICGVKKASGVRYDLVPKITYTEPQTATIGINQKQAEEIYGNNCKASKIYFKANAKAHTINNNEGFLKVITNKKLELLGASIVGPDASELIHQLALIKYANISLDRVKNVIFGHPTLSEIIWEISNLAAIGKTIHN